MPRRTTPNKPRLTVAFQTTLGTERWESVTADDRHILYAVVERPEFCEGELGRRFLASAKMRLSRGDNPARLIASMQAEYEQRYIAPGGPKTTITVYSVPITPQMRAAGRA